MHTLSKLPIFEFQIWESIRGFGRAVYIYGSKYHLVPWHHSCVWHGSKYSFSHESRLWEAQTCESIRIVFIGPAGYMYLDANPG